MSRVQNPCQPKSLNLPNMGCWSKHNVMLPENVCCHWVTAGLTWPYNTIERFRFPRWRGFWTRDITSSCVIWRHAFKVEFRRSKQTWKQSFWGWPLTCGHDVTFRRSRSSKRLSKPLYWYRCKLLSYQWLRSHWIIIDNENCGLNQIYTYPGIYLRYMYLRIPG